MQNMTTTDKKIYILFPLKLRCSLHPFEAKQELSCYSTSLNLLHSPSHFLTEKEKHWQNIDTCRRIF